MACAAGTQAVLDGLRQIQWGYADAAVVGGTEAAARKSAAEGFKAARALSRAGSLARSTSTATGLSWEKGRGSWSSRPKEAAIERGATILAELRGGASTADAHHITAPHPGGEGAERAIRLALADAGLTPKTCTM